MEMSANYSYRQTSGILSHRAKARKRNGLDGNLKNVIPFFRNTSDFELLEAKFEYRFSEFEKSASKAIDCDKYEEIEERGEGDDDNESFSESHLSDSILEAAKFLNYGKWSQMRFLCRRVNQLIQRNQSKLQAFEVKSLRISEIHCKSNSIVSFEQGIQSPVAMRKWFRDRGYSCDETTDMPLEKVFAGLNQYEIYDPNPGLHLAIRAFFDEPTKKNIPLITGQSKQMRKKRTGKARKKNRSLSNDVAVRSEPPKVFSAKFNDQYDFYGPILSHFFRLLHHPAAYFHKVSIFPPMTDRFCDMSSHRPIRCDQFKLVNFDFSLEHSLNWLKDNVRAQQIILPFNYAYFLPLSELHKFILLNASICAKDRITLDWLRFPRKFVNTILIKIWLDYPRRFVNTLIQKYETLEMTKPTPSIVLEFKLGYKIEGGLQIEGESFELNLDAQDYQKFFMPDLVPIDYPPLYNKHCDRCDIKTYEQPIKSDGSRKMIAQFSRCFERDCLCGDTTVYMRFLG
ncbi:hypothetical protein DdX_15755 [Ditylenchus destructor]|uniref:Uncharacterized protein n=1 Tax=Ditylenchus destructor TaxID=166010 RepID=A0AAD4MRM8_9BILA|nr:hypothetical protein DdX_15755 [Ditylenchus destructor]